MRHFMETISTAGQIAPELAAPTTAAPAARIRHAALKMRAAVLAAPGRIEIVETTIPGPGPRQVRVRIEGCGICGSNLPSWEGRRWFEYPFPPGAPGHEGWGIVESIGSEVTRVEPGDRVATLSCHAF